MSRRRLERGRLPSRSYSIVLFEQEPARALGIISIASDRYQLAAKRTGGSHDVTLPTPKWTGILGISGRSECP
jgi:hypothetical protein